MDDGTVVPDWAAMSIDSHLIEAAWACRGEDGATVAIAHATAALVIATQDQTEAIRELISLLRGSGKFSLDHFG